MILQNFIPFFSFIFLFLIILLIRYFYIFYIENNIRKKFFLFLGILFFFFCLGLYYSLDGIVFLFILSEFSVLLIFITMFSQLYSYTKKNDKYFSNFLIFLIIILSLTFSFYDTEILLYETYYSIYNSTMNDFYYFYNYFFERQVLVTFLIIFIITFYSIFFIILYSNLKKKQNIENHKKHNLFILRKQNILHQSNYSTKIKNFKK